EMAAGPPDLPDPFVRVAPLRLEELHELALDAPGLRIGRDAGAARLVEGVHDLAEDVELLLGRGGVADPDRRRAGVAGEPLEGELRQAPLAGDSVHDLQLLGGAGDRAQPPLAPGA